MVELLRWEIKNTFKSWLSWWVFIRFEIFGEGNEILKTGLSIGWPMKIWMEDIAS